MHITATSPPAGPGVVGPPLAWAHVPSPIGALLLVGRGRGDALVGLYVAEHARCPVVPAGSVRDDDAFADVRRQLDEYFAGRRHEFEVPIDWSLSHGFTQRILQAIAAIPFGSTSNYREVATAAGNPRATRAAGNACGANPIPIVVPCHRVLRTGGQLGGYTGGVEKKETLLTLEGILPPRLGGHGG